MVSIFGTLIRMILIPRATTPVPAIYLAAENEDEKEGGTPKSSKIRSFYYYKTYGFDGFGEQV